jgi:hypothetical protein
LGEVLTSLGKKKPLLRNTYARCFLWRQNNPEVNYSPTRISGGSVSRGGITQQAGTSTENKLEIREMKDKIKKNEMGGACSAYGRGKRCVQGFGGET